MNIRCGAVNTSYARGRCHRQALSGSEYCKQHGRKLGRKFLSELHKKLDEDHVERRSTRPAHAIQLRTGAQDECPLCNIPSAQLFGDERGVEHEVYYCPLCVVRWPTEEALAARASRSDVTDLCVEPWAAGDFMEHSARLVKIYNHLRKVDEARFLAAFHEGVDRATRERMKEIA